MTKEVIKSAKSILASKFTTTFISVLATPIIIRFLGSENYGDYAFIISVVSIIMVFINGGMFDAIRHHISISNTKSEEEEIISFYIYLSIIILVPVLLFMYIFMPRLSPVLANFFVVITGLVVSKQLFSIFRSASMGLQLEHYTEPIYILRRAIFSVLAIILLYFGTGIGGVIVAQIIAAAISICILIYILSSHVKLKEILAKNPFALEVRDLLLFNLNTVVFVLFTTMLTNIDIVILQPIAGTEETSYYKSAVVVASLIYFVPDALKTSLLHTTSNLWENEEIDVIRDLSAKVTYLNVLFTLLVSIGLLALSEEFIELYLGSDFLESNLPLLILFPGIVCFSLTKPIIPINQSKGVLRPLILISGICALLNVVLNLLLIPRMGMVGAALATSTSYCLSFYLHLFLAGLNGYNPMDKIKPILILLPSLPTILLVTTTNNYVEGTILSLLSGAIVGGITYLVSCFMIGLINKELVEELVSNVK